ncbi:MAG: hypothetical protein GTN97_03335 [Nitrosopumilaceae archaeon]|nr:hypothetical protein [Nitrosopumilaceae archaeon]
MSGLGDTTGLIGTAVGLGVTLGALGLAFGFAERAIESGRPRGKGGRRRAPADDIFDLGLTQRPQRRGKKFRSEFGDDFNIFAV